MANSELIVYAIVPAAGIGKRMKSQQPKQFLTLNNEPILSITLRTLAASKRIRKFIIPSIDIVYTRKIIASYCPDIEVEVIKGGKTRQDSVYNGLELAAKDKPDFILIHDAVRALVQTETIRDTITAATLYGSATAATRVSDTLKLAYSENDQDFIRKNVSRDLIWAVQTPQVFKTEILVKAYEQAIKDKFTGTDSTGLLERINEKVALVECPNSNIKITTPEDLKIAETYLLTKTGREISAQSLV
jgi:2-C-methyl-D-erythritol 4-phosphate cytidylyltransferase